MRSPDPTAAPLQGQTRNSARQSASGSAKNSVNRPARQSRPQNSEPRQIPALHSPVRRSAYAAALQSSVPESEPPPNRQPVPLKPAQPPRKHAPNSGLAPPVDLL